MATGRVIEKPKQKAAARVSHVGGVVVVVKDRCAPGLAAAREYSRRINNGLLWRWHARRRHHDTNLPARPVYACKHARTHRQTAAIRNRTFGDSAEAANFSSPPPLIRRPACASNKHKLRHAYAARAYYIALGL